MLIQRALLLPGNRTLLCHSNDEFISIVVCYLLLNPNGTARTWSGAHNAHTDRNYIFLMRMNITEQRSHSELINLLRMRALQEIFKVNLNYFYCKNCCPDKLRNLLIFFKHFLVPFCRFVWQKQNSQLKSFSKKLFPLLST